jgi:hypothetical protein
MPSSLTLFHSFTLGYSPHPPVSVYGTDAHLSSQLKLFLPVDSRRLGIGLPRILALPSRHGFPDLRGWTTIHKVALPSLQGPFSGDNAQAAGLECSPAIHRLRLWGLALGSASPCADCHGAGILGFSVSKVFTLICAYSFRHPHFSTLHGTFTRPLHCS